MADWGKCGLLCVYRILRNYAEFAWLMRVAAGLCSSCICFDLSMGLARFLATLIVVKDCWS